MSPFFICSTDMQRLIQTDPKICYYLKNSQFLLNLFETWLKLSTDLCAHTIILYDKGTKGATLQ